jgi:hypothetical protein
MQPALRRVALLATRAQRAVSEAFTESDVVLESAGPPPTKTPLEIEAGWSFRWWATPFRPELGPTVAASWTFGRWSVGARAILGLPLLPRAARNISSDVLDAAGLAELSYELAALAGWLDVGIGAAAGVDWVQSDVQATPGPLGIPFARQRIARAEGIARLGLRLQAAWWGGALFARGEIGGEGHVPPAQIQLPQGLGYSGSTLDSGYFVPFADVGLGLHFD